MKGRISDQVRERVRDAAHELGYQRAVARKNTTGPSAVLTLIDKSWAYALGMNQAIIESMVQTLSSGKRILGIIPVRENEATDQTWKKIKALGVDSVFSIHFGNARLFKTLENSGIPVVVVMNNNYQTDFNSVCVDDFQGAYEAGRILIKNGHRRLAYLSADLPLLTAVRRDRLVGFRKALDEFDVKLDTECSPVSNIHDYDQIVSALERLFDVANPPTALYIMDDYLGARVAQAANRLGIHIPNDLSVICAGDVLDYDEPFVPRLSTMSIQFESMGRAAVELMLAQLSQTDETVARHEVLKVKQHYIDRGSVVRIGESRR